MNSEGRYVQAKYTVESASPLRVSVDYLRPKERSLLRLLWWLHLPFAFVADFLLGVRVELATPRRLRRWGEPWRWARSARRGMVP